jgi:hypothetical protein
MTVSGKDSTAERHRAMFSGITPIHHRLQNPNLDGYLHTLIYH